MLNRKSFTYLSLSVLWLVNPVVNIGCDNSRAHTFGQADMLDLMEDINAQEWTLETDGQTYIIDFDLNQKSNEELASIFDYMGSATACGSRSFFASAHACIETSGLMLEGTVQISDAVTDEIIEEMEIEGDMLVLGYHLDNAMVSLSNETTSFTLESSDGISFSLSGSNWE